jgi:protein Tex
VRWRDANGRFAERKQLRDVPGLGPKTFEQAAGFLRIPGGNNPLDASGVHPETYPVVEKMLAATGKPIGTLMGASDVLRQLRPDQFADEKFGVITVQDIITELEKPGRDPRPDFKVAKLNDAVQDMKDLVVGMQLEGTVTNVAQFGAFVDLGVHQDGLVHVSQLANKFVRDAREIVKTGDIVSVRVVEVDLPRKRIALTMRSDAPSQPSADQRNGFVPPARGQAGRGGAGGGPARHQDGRGTQAPNAMASAFAKLKGKT